MPDPARLRRDPLFREVRRAIAVGPLIQPGERLIVAVSGGPDSVALAYLLTALAPLSGWTVILAHVDHQARPESAADARYCRSLARRLGLPFVLRRVDVEQAAAGALSWEDAARRLRYQALAEIARDAGATTIVTGHHADDQAETVMLHLLRGSGLGGLAGMATRGPVPLRDTTGIDLVRPLLDVSRSDIAAFCRRFGLRPRRDATNDSPRFTRNRLRHEIMPRLAAINPRAVESINRLASAARADHDYLEGLSAAAWERVAVERGGEIRLRRHAVAELPPAVRSRVLRRAAAAYGFETTHDQIVALDRLAQASEAGSVSLGPGVACWCAGEECGFGVVPWLDEPPAAGCLPIPGDLSWDRWRLSARRLPGDAGTASTLETRRRYSARIDATVVATSLTVRPRRPGDRYRPAGFAGSRKLQDCLVDAKVPRSERDRWPVLESGGSIVWVPGMRVAAEFAAPPDATTWCVVTAWREDDDG